MNQEETDQHEGDDTNQEVDSIHDLCVPVLK